MHELVTKTKLDPFPFVAIVQRAYAKWEEDCYPADEVRVGLAAHNAERIFHLGMQTHNLQQLRDCAAVTFSYIFNGLRESTEMSILADNVWATPETLYARVSIWKGRLSSREPLLCYHRPTMRVSPADVVIRWLQLRLPHARFFAMADEPNTWQPQSLTNALQRVLTCLAIPSPPDGKYTSYALRIGAHTEQVLLGIPLEVRMARFGWKHTSNAMSALYFDRTISVSAATHWFFGHHFEPPTAASRASLSPSSLSPAS